MKKATPRNYVEELLICLNGGLARWAEESLEQRFQDEWREKIPALGGPGRRSANPTDLVLTDPQQTLQLVLDNWHDVFKHNELASPKLRTLLFEIKDIRNAWAHHDPISFDDAYRTADSAVRILEQINSEEKETAEQIKQVLASQLRKDAHQQSANQHSVKLTQAFAEIAESIEQALHQSQQKSVEHAYNLSRQAEAETQASLDELRKQCSQVKQLNTTTERNQEAVRKEVIVISARLEKNGAFLQDLCGKIRQQSLQLQKETQNVRQDLARQLEDQATTFQNRIGSISTQSLDAALQLKKELDYQVQSQSRDHAQLIEDVHRQRAEIDQALAEIQYGTMENFGRCQEQAAQAAAVQVQLQASLNAAQQEAQILRSQNSEMTCKLEQLEYSLQSLRQELAAKSWANIVRRCWEKVRHLLPGRLMLLGLSKSN